MRMLLDICASLALFIFVTFLMTFYPPVAAIIMGIVYGLYPNNSVAMGYIIVQGIGAFTWVLWSCLAANDK
jgi:hypothetical protein